jgi:hypothetical protein
MSNSASTLSEGSIDQDAFAIERRHTYYDAASEEYVRTTTDKLTIWLDDCQGEVLKDKCNFYNSASNFISVMRILITLVVTLNVTTFKSELWQSIYLIAAIIISVIWIILGICCLSAYRKKNKINKVSDCVLKKIKDNSIISHSGDGAE